MSKTQNPGTLSGGRTHSETIDWISLVAEAEGVNFPFYEHDAYEFSRKTFKEDDSAGAYES